MLKVVPFWDATQNFFVKGEICGVLEEKFLNENFAKGTKKI